MKKILVIVLSNLRHDARVRRQISALTDQYKVTVVCFQGDVSPHYELIKIEPTKLSLTRKAIASIFLLLRFHSIAHKILHDYSHVISTLDDRKFDIVIANDVETLPLAFALKSKPKVVFDAHEYAPRHFEDKIVWRIFFKDFNTSLCRKYIPLTAAMMTVGKGLAEEYEKNFPCKPIVVTNASEYVELEPTSGSDKIRLVHHGIATPSRHLELMIEMMKYLDDRFTLDLILMVPGFASAKTRNYLEELKKLAEADKRIKILPPVAGPLVVKTIHQYDIGVFLVPPINFNYRNTLPNKLFDFIQARLGIAIGPTPEMAEIVRNYNTGVVSKDFRAEGLATELKNLTKQDVDTFKRNSAKAARELNAGANAIKIRELIASALS